MIADHRPLLCWNSRHQAREPWRKADDSTFWRPSKVDCFPDSRQLQSGDIILFQPIHPTLVQRQIQKFQRGTFTHAAIYLHAGHVICEASFADKRVVLSSLEDHLEDNCLLVRRVSEIDDQGRERIALMASTLLNTKYNVWPAVEHGLRRLLGVQSFLQNPDLLNQPFVCSTLCEQAIVAASNRSIHKRNGHYVMPEDLAATELLVDVQMTWKTVS